MYMSDYNKGNTNMMVIVGVVLFILGFTAASLMSGGGGSVNVYDEDSVAFGNQRIYTDETVAAEYFWLTGEHLSEIGHPHDSVAIKTFEIGTLEVNQFTYLLSVSDEGNEIYIVKLTPEEADPFELLEHFNETSGDISGSYALTSLHTIRVFIFYEGVHLVAIEGIFDYV